MAADLVFPAANIVGESLVWDDRRMRLFWVDIVGEKIHGLDPITGRHDHWSTPEFVTSIGLRDDGGAVVGLTKRICLWDFDDHFLTLAQVEPERPGNRLNEGVVGPDGAFWVGTMQNNIAPNGTPMEITEQSGVIYRCTANGHIDPVSDRKFGITNTFVWHGAGHFITADTLKNEVYRFELSQDGTRLERPETILAQFPRGLPDGSCMDAEGFIWNCRVVGGACLVRFAPSGDIDRIVDLPCAWPTSCAFGGKDLKTLFVTSARFSMSDAHLAANPQEGALFAVDAGVAGLPCNRFGTLKV